MLSKYYNHVWNECLTEKYSKQIYYRSIKGRFGSNRIYSEDFAECVVEYYINPENFFWKFPEKAKYINSIFHKYNIN